MYVHILHIYVFLMGYKIEDFISYNHLFKLVFIVNKSFLISIVLIGFLI